MSPRELVARYINQKNVMQLATDFNGQPWACNVHFYADDDLNLYWISTEAREHSQHIAQNPKVAAVILVHENTPAEDYVIGISVSGAAELLREVPDRIGGAYVQKLNKAPSLLADMAAGKNPHKFYQLKPSRIVLFDSKNFPDDPRKEVLNSA